MHTLLRPLAVFGVSSFASLGVLWLAGDAPPRQAPMSAEASNVWPDHRLSRLRVVREALAPIGESYVEPDRIHPERMFIAALDAVERLVPGVLFERQGARLSVHVGSHREAWDVPAIVDLATLETQLRRVAGVLEEHLSPDEIPGTSGDADPFAVIEFAIGNGMLATLDPHSALLPPEQSREMDVENSGKFGGLGINIEVVDDRLLVEEALVDRPAARAGVRTGDHIRRIDGQSTINLTIDEAVDLLRGPVGADVILEVLRDGVSEPIDVPVTRANIKINEVEGFILPGGMAYVRIPSFHSTVHRDLTAALKRMARQEGALRGLVLDLRDNPGGYLNQAISVADTFLAEGEIVATRGPHDRRPQMESAHTAGTEDAYPMVVLVNASSASASEIVAGALRNNERAVIVGERTFGKGSVQNLHALPLDSKLKITIAHYLTPGDRSIQSVGIPADIELVPVVVGEPEADAKPDALLFSRESVQRESDLNDHLEGRDIRDEIATYKANYLTSWTTRRPRYGAPDIRVDPELSFAVGLLQVAPRANRGDMLASAGPLIRRFAHEQDTEIARAMHGLNVDWTPAPTPAHVDTDIEVAFNDDQRLHAGRDNTVTVTVTNRGDQALGRLVAIVAEHDALRGAEFFFGKVDAGETRSWTRTVHVDASWPSEAAPMRLELRDGSGEVIDEQVETLRIEGETAPRLAWAWQVLPPEDGTIDVDDVVRVRLDVTNVGTGASRGATGRIRNRAGKALDVITGTVRAGQMRTLQGEACVPTTPGWDGGEVVGAAADDPRVVQRMPALWPKDCHRVLDPGATWTGVFEVRVLEALELGYRLDLSIEDVATFDRTAILGRGFYDYYRQEEPVAFTLGEPPAAAARREPPAISFTRAPDAEVFTDLTTVSGRVVDADGLVHVVMWSDEHKVFYEGNRGAEALTTIPFTADLRVAAGAHSVTVLARDARGFSSTASRVFYRPSDTWQAQANPNGTP